MRFTSDRHEIDVDPSELSHLALAEGWGDGLPLIPPTEALVERFVESAGLEPDYILGRLPPQRAACSVEKVAINAAMAGAPPESMPLICAALSAMMEPEFDLAGISATTAPATPVLVVNGAQRDCLKIPYGHSALGGFASPAPAIGRALRLIMRNVGGEVAGVTSESVFGQPGRVVGIVVGEWEERSPWPPLAERRGVKGDAVTVYPTMGTCNILDSVAKSGRELLEVIGKSLGFVGNNNFAQVFAEQAVAINPVWATDIIARDIPSFDDVREIIWDYARLPLDWFPPALRPHIEHHGRGRIDKRGMVHLMDSPEDLHIFVCGGLGSLHAAMLPGISNSLAVTQHVRAPAPGAQRDYRSGDSSASSERD
jgi:hypothetical protein